MTIGRRSPGACKAASILATGSLRHADGGVSEGPYVDSERNGHWVWRHADGTVSEGPFLDDEQNGRWVIRYPNGTSTKVRS